MIYQQSPFFILAALAAAGADVVVDATLQRVSIQEAGVNKFSLNYIGLKITKLETETGANLLAKRFKRDSYGDPIANISKKTTTSATEARTGQDLSGDYEKDPVTGITYRLYEFEFTPVSSDHGGYIPALRPKIYLYVNQTTDAARATAFESALADNIPGVIAAGGLT
jgi:hypothetical protein